MTFQLGSRVFETTTTTGTGAYSLAGAVAGYKTFAQRFDTGDTPFAVVEQRDVDGNVTGWEYGRYTLTEGSPDTLARTEILDSSNAGAAVNWGSGTKNVMCVTPAELIRSLLDESQAAGFAVRTAARTFKGVPEAAVGGFRVRAQSTPDMTARVEAGRLFLAGTNVAEIAAQNTGAITAPTVNPRIDRIVLDPTSGSVSTITGAEAASPTAPNITAGKQPLARIALAVGQAAIQDSHITDERSPAFGPGLNVAGLTAETSADNADLIAIHDNSAGALRRMTRANFLAGTAALPRSYLAGLGLANNGTDATNDIDIAVGAARDSTDAADLVLASALTKRLDANWAVGTNQGGLDTGSIANAVYHVWLIKRSDTGVVDVLFSTSASAPTMPTNYDYKRRVGSIIRSGATILAFSQAGDEFLLSASIQDVSATNPGTAAVTRTLSVPTGVKVWALYYAGAQDSTPTAATVAFIVSELDRADEAPAAATARSMNVPVTSGGVVYSAGVYQTRTNTSAQVRSRLETSGANTTFKITTIGWVDQRGKDD